MESEEELAGASALRSESSGGIEAHLSAGRHALRSIRCRVSGLLLALGVGTGLLVLVLSDKLRKAREEQDRSPRVHALEATSCLCVCSRLFFLGLAPLANDLNLTRFVLLIDIVVLIINYVRSFMVDDDGLLQCHPGCPGCFEQRAFESCIGLNTLVFICAAAYATCRTAAAPMQAAMWSAITLWLAGKAVANAVDAISQAWLCGVFARGWWWVLIPLATLCLIWRPRVRHALQEKVHRAFVVRPAQASAAGIAGLVGDCSVEQALAEAKARFRCVSLADLSQQDIADNRPNPRLFTLTMPANLRHRSDAFVSHSWHDDAVAKWAALQRWRKGFRHRQLREPEVWIDKCCIDQGNIEEDLRNLPIFLSGCSRLVMLCGTTYLSRLWCIVEVFAYVHVGGEVGEIDFVPVLRHDFEQEDMEELEAAFKAFDVRECTCSVPEDKQKLLGIIHVAFGSMQHFNEVVRAIFNTAVPKRGSGISSESSSCSDASSSEEDEASFCWSWRRCQQAGASRLQTQSVRTEAN